MCVPHALPVCIAIPVLSLGIHTVIPIHIQRCLHTHLVRLTPHPGALVCAYPSGTSRYVYQYVVPPVVPPCVHTHACTCMHTYTPCVCVQQGVVRTQRALFAKLMV